MSAKKINQQLFFWLFRLMSFGVVGILVTILYFIVSRGISVISWDFLTKSPEGGMVKGGIFPAIVGTLILIAGSLIFSFPIGVFSAIYMNEYMKDGRTKRFLQLMKQMILFCSLPLPIKQLLILMHLAQPCKRVLLPLNWGQLQF